MLSELTDGQISDKIKKQENVAECIEILKSRHSGIFHQKLNNYTGIQEVKDLKENNISFFYEVAKEYDESMSKFPTFLGNKTFYFCQDALKKTKKNIPIDDFGLTESPKLGRMELYKFVINSIEDEDTKFIVEEHLKGKTFREISEEMEGKYCGEWVRKKFNRAIDRFKTILKDEL